MSNKKREEDMKSYYGYEVWKEDIRKHFVDYRREDHAMNKIVGNESAKEFFSDLQYKAFGNSSHKINEKVLLVGPPSCGKTTIVKAFVDELGVVSLMLDANQIDSTDYLIDSILNAWAKWGELLSPLDADINYYELDSMVIFIDEVHCLTKRVQESLLKCTESDDGMLLGKERVLNCKSVCWIVATTKPGLLDKALLTRFVRVDLDAPSKKTCIDILANREGYDLEICKKIVDYVGLVPRELLGFSRLFKAYLDRSGEKDIGSALDYFLRREKYVGDGLRSIHLDLLRVLRDNANGMLLRQLVYSSKLDSEDLKHNWLASLIQLGFVEYDKRYSITEIGLELLKDRGL
jgi:Holliday junction resolvasome RuvABC ATP-dependent DNA helicase subunit